MSQLFVKPRVMEFLGAKLQIITELSWVNV